MKISHLTIPLSLMAVCGAGRAQSVLHTWYGPSTNSYAGSAVAGVGDVDHDGFDDVLVGMPNDDAAGVFAGRARLYSGKTGAILRDYLGDHANDNFGAAVASCGDVDNDGTPDFIVGAPNGLLIMGVR